MLHKKYFKKRLSDVYDLSVIKYMNGEGYIEHESHRIQVEWELNISVEGKIMLVLSMSVFFTGTNHSIKLYGKTDDSVWKISCENIKIGGIQQHVGENSYTIIFCSLLGQSLYIERNSNDEHNIDKIEGYLMNYDNYRNFEVEIDNREIIFKQQNNRDEINKYIKNKRIDRAVFSRVNISVSEGEVNDSRLMLDKLCSLLSLINMNYNFCNLVNYYSDDEIVKMEIKQNISMSFHRNVIIDNHTIRDGFKIFLEGFYENFASLNQNIDLDKFISLFSEIYSGNFIIEKKLAELIMAYEYLLTKYLLFVGDISPDDEPSIQSKICCLNRHLRFIPSNLDGDNLRSDVRNELFHIGHIPQMAFEEKVTAFDDYFDLLIRIILKMLGYSGKYLSRPDFEIRDVV